MFRTLKARWRAFLAVPRGQRFLAHHQRAHRGDTPGWARVAVIVAALVLIVLGLAMIVLPGPGLLVMPIVERLLDEYAPDVLCLQETKVPNELFPEKAFRRLGYQHIAFHGRQ